MVVHFFSQEEVVGSNPVEQTSLWQKEPWKQNTRKIINILNNWVDAGGTIVKKELTVILLG